MSKLTEKQLNDLRALCWEGEEAADRIEHLERVLVQAREALDLAFCDVPSRDIDMNMDRAITAIDEALKG